MSSDAQIPMPEKFPLIEPPTPALIRRIPALALLAVSCSVGVLVIAVAFAGARQNRAWSDAGLWTGMLVIVLPVALRLFGGAAAREERAVLVVMLGLALYTVQVLLSPDQFVLHDELGAYRTIADILRTGTLYKPPNPVDAAYSAYPGIAAATAALSRMSGLGIVPCGLILVGVARAATMVGLFYFLERSTGSARVAGVALAVYTTNPNFVYFDAQFAYESLALGLAALALWRMSRVGDDADSRWRDAVACGFLDVAVVFTHHLTSYAVTAVVCAWAVMLGIRRRRTTAFHRILALAAFSVAITLAYFLTHRAATENDIGSSIVGSLKGLYQVISGASHGKAPFTSAPGYGNPPLEQAVGLASVILLITAWPFALFAAWRSRRNGPGPIVLALGTILYPASLALRLTGAGSETSNRTSEFVFVGLAGALALAFALRRRRWLDPSPAWARALQVLGVLYVGVVFVGGLTVGNPSYEMLPGSYMVGADNRSIDTEGLAAAQWASRWLPPRRSFLADEADNELVTAYSRLNPQSGNVAGVGIGEVFVSPVFDARVRRLIQTDKLSYLVVDDRDATELPHSGHYFDGADPEKYSAPVARQALTKFNSVDCISHIFSSGHVSIYATDRVVAGCR